MSISSKATISILAIAAVLASYQAFGSSITPQLGGGIGFGFDGGISGKGNAVAPPAGCASPTAPNGAVDLSQCSNAFYVAIIF
jgi:hypothetical protein